ncbi:MAG: sigma-70 family RNA polymerase sigma factor [Holophagales bacterium]|nr:sigma-70 family RNA polymerase sigma factor [Holophagales bacterium]
MSGEITSWLARLRGGDDEALGHLVPMLYDELRGLARRLLANERVGHTLTPTALVHEAYLRLSKERRIGAEDRGEFFAVAASAMRRILVESARRRRRVKRGGDAERVPLEAVDALAGSLSDEEAEELLAIDAALDRLGDGAPRARKVVELRVFAGLTLDETAMALAVNEKTVRRDWLLARAWLRREIGGAPAED